MESRGRRKRRGENIFKEMMRKYLHHDFASEEEERYITNLLGASDFLPSLYDRSLPRADFYLPLERAERLGGRVVLVPVEETEDGFTFRIAVKGFKKKLKVNN